LLGGVNSGFSESWPWYEGERRQWICGDSLEAGGGSSGMLGLAAWFWSKIKWLNRYLTCIIHGVI